MKIHRLSEQVVNRIAAGEVVERPASVVRELVENALDAGATDISVVLEDGGRGLILVSDNGCGMGHEDALLALERHATSKIQNEDDLFNLTTLGFRGEALAAIASVSRLTLISRSAEHECGSRVAVNGGELQEDVSIAAPTGTTIEVRGLFFNTPARRKFLKSDRTEEERIVQWLSGSALAHPNVRFRLCINGKDRLFLPTHTDILQRAERLLGAGVLRLEHQDGAYRVSGALLPPDRAAYDPHRLWLLVSGRVVSDRTLLRAVREGMVGMIADRAYPVGVVHLELPGDLVDVNVHPQKSEVRFVEAQKAFLAVRRATAKVIENLSAPLLGQSANSSLLGVATSASSEGGAISDREPRPQTETINQFSGSAGLNYQTYLTFEPASPKGRDNPLVAGAPPIQGSLSSLRYLGTLFDTFLLYERDETLIMVDFHAAHERVNFNRIYSALKNRIHSAQRLLLPVSVEIGASGLNIWDENAGLLREAGFDFEPFGKEHILIREAPSWVKIESLEQLVKEIAVAEIAEGALDARMRALAARIACHASKRGGDTLSQAEAGALLEEVLAAHSSGLCPHGRPILIELKRGQLEHWFGR